MRLWVQLPALYAEAFPLKPAPSIFVWGLPLLQWVHLFLWSLPAMHTFKSLFLSLSLTLIAVSPAWAGPDQDLSRSMARKDWAAMTQAIEKGAKSDVKTKQGQPLLLWAVAEGQNALVKLLVAKGASVETKGKEGETPLMLAAAKGNKDLLLFLLEKKAKINTQDGQGYSALMVATDKHQTEIAKLLVAKGADLKTMTHKGRTVLINAAFWGYADLVKFYLSKKEVELHRRDHAGKNAYNYALEKNWVDVQALLQNVGAFE
ncbi:MAG: ankyrin repeat domain-containing protein [Candidatus Sericytochromatia bacterium]|nr:ankyrin repeat domain-containing protein [Candidatus Sericytochromatia bacterium]